MFETVFNDLIILFCFLILGYILREVIKPLQKLFIPASVIGGVLALVAGPQILGLIELPESFASMASPMIVLVMTAMFMGTTISKSSISSYAGAANVSVMMYFSQVLVGLLAGLVLSAVWKGMPEHWGLLGVFAFYGGHGTAASGGAMFEEYGLTGMIDLGIVFATIGLVAAMVGGIFIINIAARRGWTAGGGIDEKDATLYGGVIPKEKQRSIGSENVSGSGISALGLQLGILLVSIWLGNSLFQLVGKAVPFVLQFPSFLYGMVGAMIVWFVMRKTHLDGYVDKKSIGTISNFALDICVTSAVATLNLEVVSTYWAPIVIFSAIMILLTAFIALFFGKRWVNRDWFECMIIIYGQCTGSSTTGIALGRCVDPEGKTSAFESFGVAAGLTGPLASVMVATLPIVCMQSDWIVIGIAAAVVVANLIIGEGIIRRHRAKQ